MLKLLVLVDRVELVVVQLARFLMYLAGAALLGTVAILTVSSLRRYLIGTPIAATEELTGLLFVATSCLCLAFSFSNHQHIRLIVVWRHLPVPFRQWMEILGQAVALLALTILVRETTGFAHLSFELTARTDVTRILMWPWMAIIPGSLAMLGVVIGVRMLGNVLRTLSGDLGTAQVPDADTPSREIT